jgi:DNA-binding NarL/FixJ family response regulator
VHAVDKSQLTEDSTSVVIVEDDAIVRTWARLCLEGSEFRIAGEAASIAEALALVALRKPDVLLSDYRLADGVGTELVRAVRRAGFDGPAVLITANAERGLNETAREAGAQGTVLKTGSADELLTALRAVAAGGTAFDWRHPKRAAGEAALSPREREVLALVAAGETNAQIADRLAVGPETVKTLIARTFTKLGVRKRAEAVTEAHRRGLL